MNVILTMLGLAVIASSETDSSRTIGAVMTAAGLNAALREHKDSKGV